MGVFNNTYYTNEKGKTIPARMSTKYEKDFLGFSIPTKNPEEARDTVITITPDAPGATTQRIHLAGNKSTAERVDDAGLWVPSDFPNYWISRGREALKNYGNQPSYWNLFLNKVGFKLQGGTVQQLNIQEQVTALVQAAMQGDQKATQTVNQIIEAAKAGDQQAVLIATMILQIAKLMQGQATSAKWGSKLNYIKSLKFAKGGKTCAPCQEKAAAKKIEEKACGGKAKKTKKRYFGGWL